MRDTSFFQRILHLGDSWKLTSLDCDEERVRENVFICVLGYYVQKVIEKMLADYGIKMPSMRAIEKLGEIKMIESKINGRKILRSIELSSEHIKIFSAVGVSKFPDLAYVS